MPRQPLLVPAGIHALSQRCCAGHLTGKQVNVRKAVTLLKRCDSTDCFCLAGAAPFLCLWDLPVGRDGLDRLQHSSRGMRDGRAGFAG